MAGDGLTRPSLAAAWPPSPACDSSRHSPARHTDCPMPVDGINFGTALLLFCQALSSRLQRIHINLPQHEFIVCCSALEGHLTSKVRSASTSSGRCRNAWITDSSASVHTPSTGWQAGHLIHATEAYQGLLPPATTIQRPAGGNCLGPSSVSFVWYTPALSVRS